MELILPSVSKKGLELEKYDDFKNLLLQKIIDSGFDPKQTTIIFDMTKEGDVKLEKYMIQLYNQIWVPFANERHHYGLQMTYTEIEYNRNHSYFELTDGDKVYDLFIYCIEFARERGGFNNIILKDKQFKEVKGKDD